MRYKIHMIVFKLGYAYLDDIYHIIPCIPVWYTVITMLQIYMVRSPPVSYLAPVNYYKHAEHTFEEESNQFVSVLVGCWFLSYEVP